MKSAAPHAYNRIIRCIPVMLLLLLFGFSACGAGSSAPKPAASGGTGAPAFADAVFDASAAEGNDSVRVDLSHTAEGYVSLSAKSDKRLKVQIFFGDSTYTYDLDSAGAVTVYPLQSGNGSYTLKVMVNVVDKKYAELYGTTFDVRLADEFQPFLRPNAYTNYKASSDCVKKAASFSASSHTQLETVTAVFDYICGNITYDRDKAAAASAGKLAGYLPDPDSTLKDGKGICFDYASLAAAMLRSQGIPTRIVFGYVGKDGLYHAWNQFYTDETGWVTVNYQVTGKSWVRLDMTFSAGGADSSFVGDGKNYTDVYFY